MKIALINEDSQADKNTLLYDLLSDIACPLGHEVINLGMFDEQDPHDINFTQVGILASIVLESGVADFVVTGCGTGQGAMISCNAFRNVTCGYVATPLDAYLFTQVNAGNAISLPLAQSYGWGAEVNVKCIFETLLAQNFGKGYPEVYAQAQQKSRVRMQEFTKNPAQVSPLDALRAMDQQVLKKLVNYPALLDAISKYAKQSEYTTYIKALVS